MVTLVRGVATLGILGVGMAIVVIGRGVDLAIVTTYAMSAAWTLHLASLGVAICAGAAAWISAGADGRRHQRRFDRLCRDPRALRHSGNGGAGLRVRSLGAGPALRRLLAAERRCRRLDRRRFPVGRADPDPVFRVDRLPRFRFSAFTKQGRFIYAIGDNFAAARISGAPVRSVIVLQYTISASIAYVAGMITATAVSSMNTAVATSPMIYDVILVVVLGGISLSGGRGGIRNVLVGTLLIGILLNGLTILNIEYTLQNVIRSLILLAAIVLDSLINPRDEQTDQQGDI